jgi:hypothetical protein
MAKLNRKILQHLIAKTHLTTDWSIKNESTVFTHIIFALFGLIFSPKNKGAKIMRGIYGRRCFIGDIQITSGIMYPIHKLHDTFQCYNTGLTF